MTKVVQWNLKACPKCRGDLYKEEKSPEFSGWKCLQCGFELYDPQKP